MQRTYQTVGIRRWLFWLLVVGFLWVVISRLTEIGNLLQTIRQGAWQWVLLAATFQIGRYLAYTGVFYHSFATVNVKSRFRDLIPLTFAAMFINSTAPSGGAAGMAVFIDDAQRRGESAAKATAGTVLVGVADYGAYSMLLLVSLLLLLQKHQLTTLEVIGALTLFVFMLVLSAILALGLWRPQALHRLLSAFQRLVTRVFALLRRPAPFPLGWADEYAGEFSLAAGAIAGNPHQVVRTVLVGLTGHLINVVSLYCVFHAFRQEAAWGVIVPAYSMTYLFWIVSPTPNGIGIVESIMPLIYTTFGISTEAGTIINLVFRGLTFWIPMLLGFVLLRRLKMFRGPERDLAEEGQVRLIATLTGLMGIVNVLSAITPGFAARLTLLTTYSPMTVAQGGRLTAVISGFILIFLGLGLWRRKQNAWYLTMIVLAVSVASHLLKGLDYEVAIMAALLSLLLLTQRSHFHALSDVPSMRQAAWTLVGSLAFTLAYGSIGFYLLDQHYSVQFGLTRALSQTVIMFTQFYDPGLIPITGFGHYFATSIYIVGAVTFGYAFLMLLQPVLMRNAPSAADRQRAARIVRQHGRTTLARMALLHDKSYYFSEGGSVIAFAVKGRMAVALGDPIGPPADAPAAIRQFQLHCRKHDWDVAFYQAQPDHLEAYRQLGLRAVCIGQEGIVDLTCPASRDYAKAFVPAPGAARSQTAIYTPPLSDGLLSQLQVVSDEWLTDRHEQEMRFAQGWFDPAYVRQSVVVAAYDANGSLQAFANIVPEYQKQEVGVDMMRCRHKTPPAVIDRLYAALLEWAQAQGYAACNLGLARHPQINGETDDAALNQLLRYVNEHMERLYHFEELPFPRTLRPRWEPRYLVFSEATHLPAVWRTIIRASNSRNFRRQTLRLLLYQLRLSRRK